MDENTHYLYLTIKNCLLALCIIIISGMVSCQSTKYQTRKIVEAGNSPIEAACAIGVLSRSSNYDPICIQFFSNYKENTNGN